MESQDHPALQEPLENLAHLGSLEILVPKEIWDILVRKEAKDFKGLEERQGAPASRASPDCRDRQARTARQERRVAPGRLDLPGLPASRERGDLPACPAALDNPE